jgi:hypothetical protein
MRLARINGKNIDIDERTALGLTLQSYDVKKPGQRFVNITNTFSIPATSKNLAIFGFASNPQTTSTKIYEQSTFDYWVDNVHLVIDSRVRVDEISDRIKLFAYQKPSVWDEIKLVKWPDFVSDFVTWMQDNKGLPSKASPFAGNFGEFLEPYTESTEGILLPFYFGNLYNYEPVKDSGIFAEDANNIWLRKWGEGEDKADGGHFCVYVKTIFEYIESKYSVNFLTTGGEALGNIWDDAIAPKIYIPIRDLAVRNNTAGTSFYFEYDSDSRFLPLTNQKDKAGKTHYGSVNGFMQHFNIIIDDLIINNSPAIRMARFDDLELLAEVVDWSDNFTGIPSFVPFINGYAIENTITFKEIYEEGDELLNSKVLTCGNKNLDASTDLFSIDAYVPSFLPINGGIVPDMSPKESFKTFAYFINDGLSDDIINIHIEESGNQQTATFRLQKSAVYSLDGEYNLIDQVLDTPRFYTHDKWLKLNDILNLEFFKLYYIKQLGGAYFLNKVASFNPQKSNKATKLELIKISNRTPISPPDLDYWADGVLDAWTDGTGDIFF